MRFVHTSDWQIGMKGGGLGEAGALVGRQRIETIDRVLVIAEEEGAELVLASGDLFEDNKVAQCMVDDVAKIIRAHPQVEVHAIPGNHDLPGPGSVWNRAALRGIPNLCVHTEPTPVEMLGGEVTLHPFPVKSRYAGSDPLAALENLSEHPGIHVGLAHGHITTVTFGAHEQDIKLPIDPGQVERAGLDYLALGHWHGTRLVKATDGHTRVAYSGTHEQTAYAETDAGNVLVVEIEAKGALPVVRVVRSGALNWAREELTFAGDTNLGRLRELIDGCKADLLRISLSGELPTSIYGDYRELLQESAARFRDLRVRDEGLRWRADEDEEPEPITDVSLAEVQKRLAGRLAAAGGEEADVLREAASLFRRFVKEAGL